MKRRRSVVSDSVLRYRCTYDEELVFKEKLKEKGIPSMSQAVRLAVNKYFNTEIFKK